MNDEAVQLLKEIRDHLKSIDERLTQLGNPQTGMPAKLSHIEQAIRDVASNIANQTRLQNRQ